MYKSDELYWGIFILNCMFRFLWMLSFVPAKHISPSGVVVNSFSSDVQSYVGPIIACGEIIRRCIWGILRVELESIKLYCTDEVEVEVERLEEGDSFDEGKDICSNIEFASLTSSTSPSLDIRSPSNPLSSPSSADPSKCSWREGNTFLSSVARCLEKTRQVELLLWIAAFIGLGFRAVSA